MLPNSLWNTSQSQMQHMKWQTPTSQQVTSRITFSVILLLLWSLCTLHKLIKAQMRPVWSELLGSTHSLSKLLVCSVVSQKQGIHKHIRLCREMTSLHLFLVLLQISLLNFGCWTLVKTTVVVVVPISTVIFRLNSHICSCLLIFFLPHSSLRSFPKSCRSPSILTTSASASFRGVYW